MTVWCLTFHEFAGHQFQLGTRPWPRWNGYTMLKGNSEQQASVQRDDGASNGRHEARVPFLQFYTTNSVLVFFEKEKHKNPCKGWCHFYMLECPDKARPPYIQLYGPVLLVLFTWLLSQKFQLCTFTFTCQEVKNAVEVQLLPDLTTETMLGRCAGQLHDQGLRLPETHAQC